MSQQEVEEEEEDNECWRIFEQINFEFVWVPLKSVRRRNDGRTNTDNIFGHLVNVDLFKWKVSQPILVSNISLAGSTFQQQQESNPGFLGNEVAELTTRTLLQLRNPFIFQFSP